MLNMTYRNTLLASTIIAGLAVSSPALAQDANQGVTGAASEPAVPSAGDQGAPTGMQTQESAGPAEEASSGEIVVTGTLIRNPNLVSSSPVSVVGEEEIDLQQANVAEELLRELPGAVPSIGSAVNNGNGGFSFVDLRGLGSNRNITLLDGVRIVPADLLGRVDLNNIPLALVQRVDVLTGGASTTYGADAVSGVVNFITRQDFAGIDLNVSNQITGKGDGHTFRADLTLGANFDDGRGNAVFSVGYQEADPVYQGARDYSIFAISSSTGANSGSSLAPSPSSFSGVNPTGTPCGGPSEPLCSAVQGLRQVTASGGAFRTTATTPFNFNPYNIYQTPFERFNMYGAAHYEAADGIEVYTRGLFSKQTVSAIAAPGGQFAINNEIPLNNPFLSAAQRNAFCSFDTANTDLAETKDINEAAPYIPRFTPAECAAAATATGPNDPNYRTVEVETRRRATEFGPRIQDFTSTVFDYRAGVRGDVTDRISFDLWGGYGESEQNQVQSGYWLNSRVEQALLAGPNGCFDPSNGCVPLNLFGPDGSITPEMNAFLTGDSVITTITSLAQARATISGDFGVNAPWADQPISFAIGGEYRDYHASQISDLLSQSGDLGGAGGASPNIDGGFDVYEAFGELIVPIASDRPFFDELTFEAGARYSKYSVDAPNNPKFDTFTWKLGGSWAPVDALRIRGNYAHSVRAPNIFELFNPPTTILTNLADDPCASLDEEGKPIAGRGPITGVLREVCIAQGAPPSTIGSIMQPAAGQANVTAGGNSELEPEKADSWTIGAVFRPDFVPGLTMTVDYYNIKIKDAITSPTPDDLMSACFGAGNLSPTNPACTIIRRSPSGGALSGDPTDTPGLFAPLSNLGKVATDGIDLTINYTRDIGFGRLALGFVGNWTNKSTFQATPNSEVRDCVGVYSANCGTPAAPSVGSLQPEFSWTQRTTLTVDNVDVSLLWRHIGGMEYEFRDTAPLYKGPVPSLGGATRDFNVIKPYDYFDLTTRFPVTDNFTFSVSVQNLLDKEPPIVGANGGTTTFNSGNTFPSTYDALGRRFVAAARLRF